MALAVMAYSLLPAGREAVSRPSESTEGSMRPSSLRRGGGTEGSGEANRICPAALSTTRFSPRALSSAS